MKTRNSITTAWMVFAQAMTPAARRARVAAAVGVACLVGAALLGSMTATPALGETAMTPAAMAMGTARSAAARNYEAAHVNPANLALSDNGRWSLQVLSLGGSIGNSSVPYSKLLEYSGAELTEADKDDLMAEIKGEHLDLNVGVDVAGLSSSFGRYAVTAGSVALVSARVPRDVLELMFYGNEIGRTYDFSGMSGESSVLSSVGFSASHPIQLASLSGVLDELTVGGTVRVMQGWYYARIVAASGELRTDFSGAEGFGEIVTRTSESGSGFGIDLGTAARAGEWTFGMSFHNLGARINWQGGEEERRRFEASGVTVENLEDDSDLVEETEETIAIEDFKVSLPQTIRMGVARGYGRWLFAGDYVQGWGGDGLAPERAQLAGGFEYAAAGWVDLRAGLRLEDSTPTAFSGGVGLKGGPTRFDLAFVSQGGVLPGHDEGVGLALGFGLQFE